MRTAKAWIRLHNLIMILHDCSLMYSTIPSDIFSGQRKPGSSFPGVQVALNLHLHNILDGEVVQDIIRVSTSEKVHSDMCAQPDQSLRRPHEESLHPRLSKMRLVKSLIILREGAGLFEPSMCAHIRRNIS